LCLIGLALDAHPRFALVIAANRDEYFGRPAAGLDWWQPGPDAPWLLAGRDLSAGGTWMGLSSQGRLAMLTNVRDPARHRADAPSRGALVPAWLDSAAPAEALWPALSGRQCNPYNLIGADLRQGHWWWADDRAPRPRALAPGVHGLSNASLGTPWPKVRRLERAINGALANTDAAPALVERLFDALADRGQAEDSDLPDTGIGLARERFLSPVFIASPDGRYGTRCSTVLIGERRGAGWRLSLAERSFDALGRAVEERTVQLDGWPLTARPPVQVTPLR
jgi:uncharacterized protein with NRDE domain